MNSRIHRRDALGRAGGLVALPFASAPLANAPRIKVGQIGVGHAHASKLSVYRDSDEYEVVGVVEPDPELRRKAETQPAFRGVKWLTREQLFNVPDLKAVLVETRVRDSLEAARACVDHGLHVHLDKPAGESVLQFRRVLEIAAKKNLWVQMGYMFRYNPAVVLLRDVARRGWLGDVFEVHTVMSKVVPPADRRGLAEYPGGIMFELGCHVIDLVVGLLGAPDRVAAYPKRTGKFEDGLVDNMLAVFDYPRATASIRSTALEVEGGARRHLVVCGTEGTFHIQPLDAPAARVAFSRPRGSYRQGYQDVKFPRYVRYVDDAADMAKVVRGEKAPDWGAEHDLAVQTTLIRACGLELEV